MAKPAAARGPLFISSGSCCSVSGVMPCSCVAVVFKTEVPLLTSTRSWRPPHRQRDVDAHLGAEWHDDVVQRDLLEAALVGGDLVLARSEVPEGVLPFSSGDGGGDGLIRGEVARRQRRVGDDAASAVTDDAGDGAVETLRGDVSRQASEDRRSEECEP